MALRKNRVGVEERRLLYVIMKWIVDLVVVSGIAVFAVFFLGERMTIVGYSLEPTLTNGDQILIDKISYKFRNPKRFELVIFVAKDTDKQLIKRIIGLPGETIQIKDGYIYIDGELLADPYQIENEIILNAGLASEPILLEEEEYFVLGDNRNNSEDSRFATIGTIKTSSMIGKAWLYVTTLNDVKLIDDMEKSVTKDLQIGE